MNTSELQSQFYSQHAQVTNYALKNHRVIKARKLLQNYKRGKLLDVGCGDGAIIAGLNHDLYGVDISSTGIALAITKGVKASVCNTEIQQLPYESNTFDYVFTGETIEHQPDTDWFLYQINRVLKLNGTLVLTYPNIRTPIGVAMLLFGDMPPMYACRYRSPHYRDFTLKTIKKALANNGFSVYRAHGSNFWLPKIGECLSSIAEHIPTWSSSVVIEARKIVDVDYKPEHCIEEIY